MRWPRTTTQVRPDDGGLRARPRSFSPGEHMRRVRHGSCVRFAPGEPTEPNRAGFVPGESSRTSNASDVLLGRESPPILLLDDEIDPGTVVLTCANCGAEMDERKCKLICRCGYFLSCSDYY